MRGWGGVRAYRVECRERLKGDYSAWRELTSTLDPESGTVTIEISLAS